MYDFVRIATIVGNVKVADTTHNTEDLREKIRYSISKGADIILTPELSLTGYTCGDLFFQKELIESAKKGLWEISSDTKSYKGIVVLGMPIMVYNQLFNCGVVMCSGRILGIIPKTFIPEYDGLNEKHIFSSSSDLNYEYVDSCELGLKEKYDIPIGRDLVFNINNEVKFGVEICEDLYAPVSPSTFLSLSGAEIILNLSASNEITEKSSYRRSLVEIKSSMNICTYVFASAGISESTSENVFCGSSLIAENGKVIKENNNLIDNDYVMLWDTDLGVIRSHRIKNTTFTDTLRAYGKTEKCRIIFIDGEIKNNNCEYRTFPKIPYLPQNTHKQKKSCKEIFEIQVAGLKKRIETTNAKPVIGISGGLDSTLALLVCAKAMKDLNKNATDIVAVTMPGFGTTGRTYNNSVKLMESLGVTIREISIKDACIQHFSDISHDMNIHDATYENAQARERTQILMDISNQVNGFVVGTGDLSELALGWCTYNGDQMSMYGVNSGVPKTLISVILETLIENSTFEKSNEVLGDILSTPISPELLPPSESGNIQQKTEDIVGPYILHDFFLYYVLKYGFSPEKILFMAEKAFNDEFDRETILKWEKTFYRRFINQQFKRSSLPDSVKVVDISLSPKSDFKIPSDATSKIWLDALENL